MATPQVYIFDSRSGADRLRALGTAPGTVAPFVAEPDEEGVLEL